MEPCGHLRWALFQIQAPSFALFSVKRFSLFLAPCNRNMTHRNASNRLVFISCPVMCTSPASLHPSVADPAFEALTLLWLPFGTAIAALTPYTISGWRRHRSLYCLVTTPWYCSWGSLHPSVAGTRLWSKNLQQPLWLSLLSQGS